MKNRGATIAAAVILIIGAAALGTFFVGKSFLKQDTAVDAGAFEDSQTDLKQETEKRNELQKELTYQGKEYVYNNNLRTCLFLGVDTVGEVNLQEHPGEAGQADCILLFIMDPETKKTTLLEISRNTLVDVDIYDFSGRWLSEANAQIALQYAYGDGKTKSSWLMKQTVSKLLSAVKIDAALAMNIEGVATATDFIGGVTLTLPEDYTYIDPALKKGETVTLKGELAEKYVRYRDVTQPGSNEERMTRQSQFIQALAGQLKSGGGKNTAFYQSVLNVLEDYINTDLSAEDLKSLAEYDLEKTVRLPGKERTGERYDEFVVDEEALTGLIVELFYQPADTPDGK